MGQVVGGVVVGVQARPLGAERVVGRAQHLGRLGIVDDLADLAADVLGNDLVGVAVGEHVGERAEDREQLAGLHAASKRARCSSGGRVAAVS